MESRSSPNDKKINQELYKKLTRKISNVNKQLLNTEIQISTLKKLEKDAVRDATLEKPEPCIGKKKILKPDLLSLILKSQHKLTESVCIVKLPKMPYGKHADYNDDSQFVIRHFFNTASNIAQIQSDDLNEIKKKFRLYEKRKLSQKRTGSTKKTSASDFFDTFNMEHGDLICPKVARVSEGYSKDKEKYRKYIYEQYNKRIKKNNVNKDSQDKTTERLSSSKHRRRSVLVEKLTTKYSKLFRKQASTESYTMPDLSILNL